MAGMEDFSEGEWQSILDELRILVIGSGFAQWDEAMMAALEEEEDSIGAQDTLVRYGRDFVMFLKVRSEASMRGMRDRLDGLVRQEGGEPVASVLLESRLDDSQELLSYGDTSDAFTIELSRIFSAIADRGGGFPEDFDLEPEDEQ